MEPAGAKVPAAQLAQTELDRTSEVPGTHSSQTRSDVAVGARSSVDPAGQTVSERQARLLVKVGATVSNSVAVQFRSGAQTRSEVGELGVRSNVLPGVHTERETQTRSETKVGALCWYSVAEHVVMRRQSRSEVAVGAFS
jgi:hypothetical protein